MKPETTVVQSNGEHKIPYLRLRKKDSVRKPITKTDMKPEVNALSVVFDSPSLADAKATFNSLVSSGRDIPSDPNFFNKILHSFSSVSCLQDSVLFLNHMIKKYPAFCPNHFTYHILLKQSCSLPDEQSLLPVTGILNLMKDSGFPPNVVSMDIAVRSLCECGGEERAVELVKELAARNVLPDTYTYNLLVKHLVKNRSISTADSFISEMKEFGIKPDIVTFTIMIDNVCNSKNLREATRLLSLLRVKEGLKPDCCVYNIIMKGYCNLNQGDEVLAVYKRMQDEEVEPDRITYNTLIYGLAICGRVKEAKKFLTVMRGKGYSPDAVTYTSLMNGLCRKGDALGAMALLEEMKKECDPNSCTYNTLLYGLCKARLLDEAVKLYKVMKNDAIKLETGTYGTFLRALCRKGRVADAYEVFDYAVETKSFPVVAAYSTLESTLKWLRNARERGVVV